MDIKRTITECGDLIVKLNGDFDALSVAEIRPDFEAITAEVQQQIILDLRQVGFIDSSGIGAIVFLYKRLKAEGRGLELTGARGQPKQLLELLRIHQVISIR
ncbi:STAS domain-containing protein [Photobacterium lipolyticum]|uniref:Anti-sigma-factor n=1 Tax=Photobacterium lipolyticum TaxID=266810 RepID=A0A2T3N0L6_9GAMM|nr:STAS domain-containing protein [Photobacterium lipolyticum]PSW05750.1 anti-sigma-factor [Photobacterium lipolyticum]